MTNIQPCGITSAFSAEKGIAMDNLERRAWAESRAEASDNGRKIRGYPVVFNSLSVDLGGFREVISPEAVDRTLNEGLDVRALVDHDTSKVIGRTRAGTLRLRKDSRGLFMEVEPDEDISYARDIMRAVARGDVSGMSFGFRVDADEWNHDGKVPVRTVTDMRVSEVSIVTFPAYQATDVQVAQRSLRVFQQAHKGNRVAWLEKKMRLLRAS
jgi:HK97 family phage prohead protease